MKQQLLKWNMCWKCTTPYSSSFFAAQIKRQAESSSAGLSSVEHLFSNILFKMCWGWNMSIMNLSSGWEQIPLQACKVAFAGDMTYNKRVCKCPCECQKSITLCFPCGLQGCICICVSVWLPVSLCLCVCVRKIQLLKLPLRLGRSFHSYFKRETAPLICTFLINYKTHICCCAPTNEPAYTHIFSKTTEGYLSS